MTRLTQDRAISIDELADELASLDGDIYLSGDGYDVTAKGLTAKGVAFRKTPTLLITENAYSVARVGYRQHLAGNTVSDSEITATYLRLPQAERERLERINGGKK